MNIQDLSIETNELARELVNIARSISPVSEYELVKNGLIDSASLFAGTIDGLNYETDDSVIVAKINQANDAGGRTIFWVSYLNKESLIDDNTGSLLQNKIGTIAKRLITYRIEKEKNITPSFQGEWLLED